jgi:hypothetical protein
MEPWTLEQWTQIAAILVLARLRDEQELLEHRVECARKCCCEDDNETTPQAR